MIELRAIFAEVRVRLASRILGRDVTAIERELQDTKLALARTEARLDWILVDEGCIDEDDLDPEAWAAARAQARADGVAR